MILSYNNIYGTKILKYLLYTPMNMNFEDERILFIMHGIVCRL